MIQSQAFKIIFQKNTESMVCCNIHNSGETLTKTLLELEQSGFIEKYLPYQGTKDSVYRLTVDYSMFYIKYIENTKPSASGIWFKIFGQPSYKIWSGFSFETICLNHLEQIKKD